MPGAAATATAPAVVSAELVAPPRRHVLSPPPRRRRASSPLWRLAPHLPPHPPPPPPPQSLQHTSASATTPPASYSSPYPLPLSLPLSSWSSSPPSPTQTSSSSSSPTAYYFPSTRSVSPPPPRRGPTSSEDGLLSGPRRDSGHAVGVVVGWDAGASVAHKQKRGLSLPAPVARDRLPQYPPALPSLQTLHTTLDGRSNIYDAQILAAAREPPKAPARGSSSRVKSVGMAAASVTAAAVAKRSAFAATVAVDVAAGMAAEGSETEAIKQRSRTVEAGGGATLSATSEAVELASYKAGPRTAEVPASHDQRASASGPPGAMFTDAADEIGNTFEEDYVGPSQSLVEVMVGRATRESVDSVSMHLVRQAEQHAAELDAERQKHAAEVTELMARLAQAEAAAAEDRAARAAAAAVAAARETGLRAAANEAVEVATRAEERARGLAGEVKRLDGARAAAEAEAERLASERAELAAESRRQASTNDQLMTEVDRLEAEAADLAAAERDYVAALGRPDSALLVAEAARAELRELVDELQEELEEARQTAAEAVAAVREAEAAGERAAAATAATERMQATVVELKGARNELLEALDDECVRARALETELSRVRREYQKVLRASEDWASERTRYESALSTHRDEIADLQARLQAATLDCLALGGAAEDEPASTRKLRAEFREMLAELQKEHTAQLMRAAAAQARTEGELRRVQREQERRLEALRDVGTQASLRPALDGGVSGGGGGGYSADEHGTSDDTSNVFIATAVTAMVATPIVSLRLLSVDTDEDTIAAAAAAASSPIPVTAQRSVSPSSSPLLRSITAVTLTPGRAQSPLPPAPEPPAFRLEFPLKDGGGVSGAVAVVVSRPLKDPRVMIEFRGEAVTQSPSTHEISAPKQIIRSTLYANAQELTLASNVNKPVSIPFLLELPADIGALPPTLGDASAVTSNQGASSTKPHASSPPLRPTQPPRILEYGGVVRYFVRATVSWSDVLSTKSSKAEAPVVVCGSSPQMLKLLQNPIPIMKQEPFSNTRASYTFLVSRPTVRIGDPVIAEINVLGIPAGCSISFMDVSILTRITYRSSSMVESVDLPEPAARVSDTSWDQPLSISSATTAWQRVFTLFTNSQKCIPTVESALISVAHSLHLEIGLVGGLASVTIADLPINLVSTTKKSIETADSGSQTIKRNSTSERRLSSQPEVVSEHERLVPVMTVWSGYTPSVVDEIALNLGDKAVLNILYDDGWAHGTNLTSGESGMLPIAVLVQDNSVAPIPLREVQRIQHGRSMVSQAPETQGGTSPVPAVSPLVLSSSLPEPSRLFPGDVSGGESRNTSRRTSGTDVTNPPERKDSLASFQLPPPASPALAVSPALSPRLWPTDAPQDHEQPPADIPERQSTAVDLGVSAIPLNNRSRGISFASAASTATSAYSTAAATADRASTKRTAASSDGFVSIPYAPLETAAAIMTLRKDEILPRLDFDLAAGAADRLIRPAESAPPAAATEDGGANAESLDFADFLDFWTESTGPAAAAAAAAVAATAGPSGLRAGDEAGGSTSGSSSREPGRPPAFAQKQPSQRTSSPAPSLDPGSRSIRRLFAAAPGGSDRRSAAAAAAASTSDIDPDGAMAVPPAPPSSVADGVHEADDTIPARHSSAALLVSLWRKQVLASYASAAAEWDNNAAAARPAASAAGGGAGAQGRRDADIGTPDSAPAAPAAPPPSAAVGAPLEVAAAAGGPAWPAAARGMDRLLQLRALDELLLSGRVNGREYVDARDTVLALLRDETLRHRWPVDD
ncbi:hypothetical protein HK405_015999 [Cladochytrium tenue]|nr:hypothetical protein HK405_015999 [Cladochytrium tenue]